MTEVPTPGVGKYYTQLTIGKYKRRTPFDGTIFDKKLCVHLPLPNEMRDDTPVSYTNINLETVGDLINGSIIPGAGAAILRRSGDIATGAGSFLGNIVASAMPNAAAEKAVDAVGKAVGSLFPADQITSALQQSMGLAPNPNPSVAFQGPILRDFSYTWAFYPKSRDESEKIQGLIKVLKRSALPRHSAVNSASILDYPDMVQINFYPWDTGGDPKNWGWTDKSIIRYKKCFMQSVNVNYHPFGTPAFFEGTNLPVTYQVTIAFRETEYMLSEDWKNTVALPLEGSGRGIDIGAVVGASVKLASNTINNAGQEVVDTFRKWVT